jgi:NAD(P)H-flavin reductase/hemoglobin-like flavoprotein
MVDTAALRRSFGQVASHGDEVPLFFYSYLFLRHPHLRSMFPPGMATQRGRLVEALSTIVSDVDNLDALVPYLQHLGRDHRKFDVVADHYPAVGEAFLATLQHFLGAEWTPQLATEWEGAYQLIADVMIKAAAADAERPAWWAAEIIRHERRGPDIAVITVRPESPLSYLPGQSVSVQTERRARLWRFYSPANAPRPDNTLELHVRAVDGGWVSSALVFASGTGDRLELGPPVGDLVLDVDSDADILMIAGGTGLAPLRAMTEQLAAGQHRSRRVHLFVEGRTERDHYDLSALDSLAGGNPWLTVVPVARQGLVTRAHSGSAADVALRQARWFHHDVYVCGGPSMVAETCARLVQEGVDPTRIRYERFGYRNAPAPDVISPDLAQELTVPDRLTADRR